MAFVRHYIAIVLLLLCLSGIFIFKVVGVSGGRGRRGSRGCCTSVNASIAVIVVIDVLCPTLWQRKTPPVVVVVLCSNHNVSCCPPLPSLLHCSSLPAHCVLTFMPQSSPRPPPPPAPVAASAMTWPLSHLPLSPQPLPHRQTPTSSLAMTALLLARGTLFATLAVLGGMLPSPPYLATPPPTMH